MPARPTTHFRHLIDWHLALTLRHHVVTAFAKANVKDFEGSGVEKVRNPWDGNL